MSKRGQRLNEVETQAAAWLARRDRGLSVAEEQEFRQWRDADARHQAAVAELEAFWTAFDRPAQGGRTDALRSELSRLSSRDRRRWLARGLAASTLAAAALAVVFWPGRSRAPAGLESLHPAAAAVTARVDWPERRTLPDGSIAELKEGAEIAVAFDEHLRRVVLRRGEAHFEVTKNPQRPFIVEAGDVQVRAVGTAFAVQLGHRAVEVLVTEGVVRVIRPDLAPAAATPEAPAVANDQPLVAKGQRAVVPLARTREPAAVTTLPAVELGERLSWRLPRLDFSETTLGEACLLFNRHNAVQLRIIDPAVARMCVTGVFRADNVHGFVHALEASLGVRAEERGREIELRAATP